MIKANNHSDIHLRLETVMSVLSANRRTLSPCAVLNFLDLFHMKILSTLIFRGLDVMQPRIIFRMRPLKIVAFYIYTRDN